MPRKPTEGDLLRRQARELMREVTQAENSTEALKLIERAGVYRRRS